MTKFVCVTPSGALVAGQAFDSRNDAASAAESEWKKPFIELQSEGFAIRPLGPPVQAMATILLTLPESEWKYICGKSRLAGRRPQDFASLVMANGIRMLREECGDA